MVVYYCHNQKTKNKMLSNPPLRTTFGQTLPPSEVGFVPGQPLLTLETTPLDTKESKESLFYHLGDAGLLMVSEDSEFARRDLGTLWNINNPLFTGEYIKASAGEKYSHLFGRDSEYVMHSALNALEAAESNGGNHNLLQSRFCPIIERGICKLVSYIGINDEKIGDSWRPSGEAPGKVLHEAGEVTGPLERFAVGWHDIDETNEKFIVYYGSVDSTPLFISGVGKYDKYLREHKSAETADDFLQRKVDHYRGKTLTVGEGVHGAVNWVVDELHASDIGFIESRRMPGQDKRTHHQTLKDSLTAYVHASGELANTNAPIASIEVQAMAYDALLDAADLFERAPKVARQLQITSEIIETWRREATMLRDRIIDRFWNAEDQRFAQAIDRNPRSGRPRQVDVPTSNEMELLDSRVLHDLPQAQQQQCVTSLVRQVMSDEFLTDAGIRCRAKSAHGLVEFTDYHGSWAVWPVISHKIADGLLGWGFNTVAYQLDARNLNFINIVGDNNEFGLVDPETNEVFYRYISKQQAVEQSGPDGKLIVATNTPEYEQAWSEAAALDVNAKIAAGTYDRVNPNRPDWVVSLEREILEHVKPVEVIKDFREIHRRRQQSPLAIIDIPAGKAADASYYEQAERMQHVLSAA